MAEEKETHAYECPECGCEFEREAGEPERCECPECDCEVDTREVSCACCGEA